MNRADVLVVTGDAFPPHVRIEKEVLALEEAGYSVVVLACLKPGEKGTERFSRSRVLNLSCGFFKGFPLLSIQRFVSLLSDVRPRAVHVHNIQVGLQALVACRVLRIPCVLDLHEVWSLLVLDDVKPVTLRYFAYAFVTLLELLQTKMCDRLIVVVDEAKKYMIWKYGLTSSKVDTVMNLASPGDFAAILPAERLTNGDFILCYVGGLDLVRNLETVLHAFALLSNAGRTGYRFVIVGGNPPERLRKLKELSKDLGIEESTVFTGRLSFDRAMSYALASDACIVPHKRTRFTDRSIPYKLTQYMGLGKPVISTPLAPVVRMYSQAVRIWDGESAENLAQILLYAAKNSTFLSELGSRGRCLTNSRNWDAEKAELVGLYDLLLHERVT